MIVTKPKRSRPKLATLGWSVKQADTGTASRLAGPATQRTRGRALMEVRARWRKTKPLCAACQAKGIFRFWTELDHIVPLFKGGADDDSNRQGLCSPCHAKKTAEDMAGGVCVR